MLPDPEVQNFLQEWFGYNLVLDTSQQTFVLLLGEGANGKTVVCIVLRSLLGASNVSAVGLEQFDPKRTFPLAAMIGKLANIVEEIGETDRTAEGVLKDLVSNGRMTIERKHQDGFEAIATARLTFATNVLPRFKDRTDGLWRRMMPIPFKVQVLNPEEQKKNLVEYKWWENSGELPGIFNWALRGLVRLREQGSFTQAQACLDLRNEYKKDANPASEFIKAHCVLQPGRTLASTFLYSCYSRWMKNQNANPLGSVQFSKEIKRIFPNITQSENAKRQSGGARSREWEGIYWLENEPPFIQQGDY